MNVLLISTYDLGHQPFGLASPAAWLRARGHQVSLADLAVGSLPALAVREAEFVGFYLPMHTATRLAAEAIGRVRLLNPHAALCAFGLYAAVNEEYLRALGVGTVLGGEFEAGLLRAVERVASGDRQQAEELISLERLHFPAPDRTGLPPLARYAALHVNGGRRRAGYTEASRGCLHRCRHCPVVPVYNGVFRIVQREAVLEDIRRLAAAGAEHITFGDPDFFNGPAHAARIVEQLHTEFPSFTYDVTIKVEHLLRHRRLLPVLRRTGCLFVTSAVESLDDDVLARLEKGHTRQDFFEAVRISRAEGVALSPTFIPFTPWTTMAGYRELLETIAGLELVENVSPVQLALRLLIPNGSRLLELEDVRTRITGFDAKALVHRWRHDDTAVDELARRLLGLIHDAQKQRRTRSEIFRIVAAEAGAAALPENYDLMPRATVPYLDEPWYC
ncbi:MAG: CUAEP/CCAEP-tail radical SAM (seleno)protein [Bryobacteraceae bacterium]